MLTTVSLKSIGLLAFGCLFSELSAAVIVRNFDQPLAPNTHGLVGNMGPGYTVDGVVHRFWWMPAPAEIDLDGNGTSDIIFTGSGRSAISQAMFASLSGTNTVWSRAGGEAGLDHGTIATALIGGTLLGPSLSSPDPQIGWHNDESTLGASLIMEMYHGSPAGGEFFPSYPFEPKYLGIRFSIGEHHHFGWLAISGYFWLGEELFIHQWAYESEPNTGIVVGMIPEPGTFVLAIMSTFWALTRRRGPIGHCGRTAQP